MKTTMICASALALLLAASNPMPVGAQSAGGGPGMMGQGSSTMGPGTMGPGTMGPGTMGTGMMGQGPGMMMGRGGPGAMMGGMGMGMMMDGPAQFMDGRIAFLRAELKITEAQKPLFDAYAEALRTAAGAMQPMHERMWSGNVPQALPDRLQWHIDEMAARLKALEAVKAAALPLYESLSGEQKQAADRLVGPMGLM